MAKQEARLNEARQGVEELVAKIMAESGTVSTRFQAAASAFQNSGITMGTTYNQVQAQGAELHR